VRSLTQARITLPPVAAENKTRYPARGKRGRSDDLIDAASTALDCVQDPIRG
jgi:hypothetical protein